MTPIQYFLVLARTVFSVDFAFNRSQVCVCATEEKATWVAWSMGRAHKVEVKHSEDTSTGAKVSRSEPGSTFIDQFHVRASDDRMSGTYDV